MSQQDYDADIPTTVHPCRWNFDWDDVEVITNKNDYQWHVRYMRPCVSCWAMIQEPDNWYPPGPETMGSDEDPNTDTDSLLTDGDTDITDPSEEDYQVQDQEECDEEERPRRQLRRRTTWDIEAELQELQNTGYGQPVPMDDEEPNTLFGDDDEEADDEAEHSFSSNTREQEETFRQRRARDDAGEAMLPTGHGPP